MLFSKPEWLVYLGINNLVFLHILLSPDIFLRTLILLEGPSELCVVAFMCLGFADGLLQVNVIRLGSDIDLS